jgi:hypothetical protein
MKFNSSALFGCLLAAAMVPATASAGVVLANGIVESITVGEGTNSGNDISVKLRDDHRTYALNSNRNLDDNSGYAMLELLLRSKTGTDVKVDLGCNQTCSGNTFDVVRLK